MASDITKKINHTMVVSKKWFWPVRLLFIVIAGYFIRESYFGYINETIYVFRSNSSPIDDPFTYWLTICGNLIIAVVWLWQAYKVQIKN